MLSSQNLGERVLRHQFLLRRLLRSPERGQQWQRQHHLLRTRLGQDQPDLSPPETSRPEDQTHTLLSPRLHTQPLDDGIQRVRNENTKAINSICFFFRLQNMCIGCALMCISCSAGNLTNPTLMTFILWDVTPWEPGFRGQLDTHYWRWDSTAGLNYYFRAEKNWNSMNYWYFYPPKNVCRLTRKSPKCILGLPSSTWNCGRWSSFFHRLWQFWPAWYSALKEGNLGGGPTVTTVWTG